MVMAVNNDKRQWTSEKPTKSGFYYYRQSNDEEPIVLKVEILDDRKGLMSVVWLPGDNAAEGFLTPTGNSLKPERHFGLRSVGERIQDLGGQLRIESDIGKGCTATITIPLRYIEADRAAKTIQKDRVLTVQHDPHQQTLPLP